VSNAGVDTNRAKERGGDRYVEVILDASAIEPDW
jgi:hypothetical protein